MRTDTHALLQVVTPTLGGCRIIRHHQQAVTKLARSQGYLVAEVVYRMIDGAPDEETLRYAREFAAAPVLLAALTDLLDRVNRLCDAAPDDGDEALTFPEPIRKACARAIQAAHGAECTCEVCQ